MHSSRMRTARLLTVSGRGSVQPGDGVLHTGGSAQPRGIYIGGDLPKPGGSASMESALRSLPNPGGFALGGLPKGICIQGVCPTPPPISAYGVEGFGRPPPLWTE